MLERLLDTWVFFRTRLEVADVVIASHFLSFFTWHIYVVYQVSFTSNKDNGYIFNDTILVNRFTPLRDSLKWHPACQIKADDNCVRVLVKCFCKGSESFLTSRVPDIDCQLLIWILARRLIRDFDVANSYCCLLGSAESLTRVCEREARLSWGHFSYDNHRNIFACYYGHVYAIPYYFII